MTALEATLLECQWCRTENGFTTVKEGFGFVIYRLAHQMWLVGLSRETVLEQRKIHDDVAPRITGFWKPDAGAYTDRMFEVPATPDLVSAVIFSVYPELT